MGCGIDGQLFMGRFDPGPWVIISSLLRTPLARLWATMQSSSWTTVIDCLAASLFLYLFVAFRDHTTRRGLPYPPGPSPLPLIGNLPDVPKRSAWVAYQAMSKEYGEPACS